MQCRLLHDSYLRGQQFNLPPKQCSKKGLVVLVVVLTEGTTLLLARVVKSFKKMGLTIRINQNPQGSKNVLSGCPGQFDCSSGQVTFHSYLADG